MTFFAYECNAKKNDPQEIEAKFASQWDNENIMSMVIAKAENNSRKNRCNWLKAKHNRLPSFENMMVTT